jgi:hypothetical protein
MKKQHFLLVLLLAFFAGITNVNAQCVANGFTPAAGVPYTYDVTIGTNPAYTGAGTYTWYVTQNVDILLAGGIIGETNTFFTVNETAPYSTYNDVTNTTNQINLTWTPAAVSSINPFYLVLRYSENNTTSTPTCAAENIRVWQIDPINTFLLAIEGATNAGAAFANAEQCAAPLVSALVTPNANPLLASVEYTYGVNTIYYRVTASGILGQWRPSIQIPNLANTPAAGLQTYTSVQWTQDLTGAGTWYDFVGAAGANTGGNFASADANLATVTDAVAGTPILIRISIDNANYETLADQLILVGIDGYLPTGFTESDIWGPGTWPGNPDPCAQADPFAKQATYTILARPTINPGATMPAFIQKLP